MASMPKIPLQTLRFLAIGAVAVLGLVLFVIFPYHRALRQADERSEALRVQIEEQRALHPVFVRYLTRLGRGETEIALPAPRPLSREATGNIYGVFQRLADGFDLTVTEVMPDSETMFDRGDRFMVDIAVEGTFDRLQPFLRKLAVAPYLAQVDRMQVRPVEDRRELRLRLWLLRETGPDRGRAEAGAAAAAALPGRGSDPS